MRFYGGLLEISGVCRIVINRTQEWVRTGDEFEKVSGGPGFKVHKTMHVSHMVRKLDRMLGDPTLFVLEGIEPQYRAWFKEGTLNVVRNDREVK
ncbi:MAG: hypothetical protein PHH09_03960 [Methanoregulaceae archaeon]|nr:hypothetical protein [Methanoregulaceae archaeon]